MRRDPEQFVMLVCAIACVALFICLMAVIYEFNLW